MMFGRSVATFPISHRRGRGHFNDDDVTDVAKLALTGLVRQPAA
jgi:hypothetical protein